jgi:hypothetical protein
MLDRLDSPTGSCGFSLPTLFKRIGSMAARGQHRPADFTPRACSACSDPNLPDTPAIPRSRPTAARRGPEVPARSPVKTTATSITSRTGNGSATGIRMESQGLQGPSPKQHTLQTGASGEDRLRRRHRPPLRPDLPARLTRARVRQLETKADRQAVPRAAR